MPESNSEPHPDPAEAPSSASESGQRGSPDVAGEVDRQGVMSFGEHLEELRRSCIFALLGLVAATLVSLYFADDIVYIIIQPATAVLRAHHQPASIQALGPSDAFLTYLKMALMSGIVISMPWILWQIWRFVALGLYRRERRFLSLFAPVSIGLFLIGVLFLFFVVLPVALNYLVGFGDKIRGSTSEPSPIQRLLIGGPPPADPHAPPPLEAHIPCRATDPESAPVGSVWINTTRNTYCVQTKDFVLESPMQRATGGPALTSQFALRDYISFVLTLALAFGLAFELPLVILFLTGTGIVSVATLSKKRRHVILGVVVAAAFLTPPDVVSQVLLAVPMIVLFEGSLLASRIFMRRREAAT